MNCPKCEEEMDFEDIKNYSGYWYCCECDIEYAGSRVPCESDGAQITDVEETMDDCVYGIKEILKGIKERKGK